MATKRQTKAKAAAPANVTILAFPAQGLPRTPRTVALAKLLASITRDYVRQAA